MTSNSGSAPTKRPYIGGQAVIEGVMMRSPKSFAINIRRKSGVLIVRERQMPDPRTGLKAWPFIRGMFSMVEALRLGSQALQFSSDHYERDLELEEAAAEAAKAGGQAQAEPKPKKPAPDPGVLQTFTSWMLALATMDTDQPAASQRPERKKSAVTWVAMILAIAVLVALPQAIAYGASALFHLELDLRSPGFQALTGFFKLCVVVGYMLLIRRVPEIYRVFQYHGAEHKTIAAWEAEQELTVQNARSKSRLHPRCGTAFLVLIVAVSILVFTAVAPLLPHLNVGGAKALENVLLFLMKLPLLPVIAGITFELQRLTAKYCLTGPLRILLYPGFAVQLITTVEPDDSQLQVAIGSFKATLWREYAEEQVPPSPADRTFATFEDLMAFSPYKAQPGALSSDPHAAT